MVSGYAWIRGSTMVDARLVVPVAVVVLIAVAVVVLVVVVSVGC